MSLCQWVRVFMLFAGVILSLGSKTLNQSSGLLCDLNYAKLRSGVKLSGYTVKDCLGQGTYDEVWSVEGYPDRVLNFVQRQAMQPDAMLRRACLWGRIAAQKDPEHFVNCFSHGSFQGDDYVVLQMKDGQKVGELCKSANGEEFKKVFPDLRSVFDHLNQLFHMFNALQQRGRTGSGKGVRQWHRDANVYNMLASAEGMFKLIDYFEQEWCCDDQDCSDGISGFEDIKLQTCRSHDDMLRLVFQAHTAKMIDFVTNVALREEFNEDPTGRDQPWFRKIRNTSSQDLVKELQSTAGPSKEMYQHQWTDQFAKVILAMASTYAKGDPLQVAPNYEESGQWPPPFMGPLKVALRRPVPQARSLLQSAAHRKIAVKSPIHKAARSLRQRAARHVKNEVKSPIHKARSLLRGGHAPLSVN